MKKSWLEEMSTPVATIGPVRRPRSKQFTAKLSAAKDRIHRLSTMRNEAALEFRGRVGRELFLRLLNDAADFGEKVKL